MFVLGSIKFRLIALHLIAVLAVAVVLPLALYWRIDATARALHERALREQAFAPVLFVKHSFRPIACFIIPFNFGSNDVSKFGFGFT